MISCDGGAAIDTNVLVAALAAWHPRHAEIAEVLNGMFETGETVFLPAHSLIECYSVLTRMRPPHRLAPGIVARLLGDFVEAGAQLVALPAGDTLPLIERLAAKGIGGGNAYDAAILAAAEAGGARCLLTFNRAHFERIGSGTVAISAV